MVIFNIVNALGQNLANSESCSILTLLVCQSEWPRDKPFLLMHSSYVRNFYNIKIKRIFEIAWTLFEIILFIHLNKHLDGAKSTLWKKLQWTIVYHFKWIHLAQNYFDFNAYFLISFDCAKFQKDWTTLILDILQWFPPLVFLVFVIHQKFIVKCLI